MRSGLSVKIKLSNRGTLNAVRDGMSTGAAKGCETGLPRVAWG